MRRRFLTLSLLATACTMKAYPGPSRPSYETAIIETSNLWVNSIDGLLAQGNRFEVLPGHHVLVVRLNVTKIRPLYHSRLSSAPLKLCVKAGAKGLYLIEPKIDEAASRWEPIIRDGITMQERAPCGPDEDEGEDENDDAP